jgi:hypothetical protein
VEEAPQLAHRQPEPDVEDKRRLVNRWREVCVICRARGRVADDHRHWREYPPRAEEKLAVEQVMGVLKAVRFDVFSGYTYCKRSQAVCELWARR